ncbi:MAG TPA: translocation/assembly module TamB domain-containing protein [Candidatus Saccharimonadales bacterium]|jgi:translocation and assembly module TamB|nr:translocation/assembly module TamB domain-containing protein [Candidatus Saccharimonadales bacterium]
MSGPAPSSSGQDSRPVRWKRRKFHLLSLACLLALMGGLSLYLQSDSFREVLRRKVITELEAVTGGKVEIESLSWRLTRLEFDLRGLTIHGTEGQGQTPYVHAARLTARLRVTSLFSRGLGLRSLSIEHPVVHLMVKPDGTTNQPAIRVDEQSSSLVQTLFDLDIRHVLIANGELLINEKKFPFDVSGERFAATLHFSPAEKTYNGTIAAGMLSASYQRQKPLQGDLDISFVLRPAKAEIGLLRFKTALSTIEADGAISNFLRPVIGVRYRASLDLKELGSSLDIRELRGGHADLQGTGHYGEGQYAAGGKISIRALAWSDASLRVTGIDLASPFALTPQRISVPQIVARVFGGSAQGDLQVENWNTPEPSGKSPAQSGAASLRFAGMQLGQMAAAASTARLPLDKIHAVGAASGDLKMTWQGSLKSQVTGFRFNVVPPATPGPQQVPVSAQMQATYHGASQQLDVGRFSLATRGIKLNIAGSLGSRETQLQTELIASDLHEVRPLLVSAVPGARVPLNVEGRARFSGAVFGRLSAPSVRGHIEAENLDLMIELPAPAAGAKLRVPNQYHFDSLAADINYTPASLTAQNGVLKRGTTQLNFAGSATLEHGQFDENRSDISATIKLQNGRAEELQALAGLSYPVSGPVNASVRLTGKLHHLGASGSFQTGTIQIAGEPFRSLHADISFAGNETRLNHMVLTHNGSQVTGAMVYDLASRQSRFDASGANIDLATVRRWIPARLAIDGQADFHVTGSGFPDRAAVDGQFNLHRLVINGEEFGDLKATAETHGAEMTLKARATRQSASLAMEGNITLRGDFPGTLTLKFEHFDFDPVIPAYLEARVTGHSSMDGSIQLHGPMRFPRELAVTGNISQLTASVESVKLQNDGPIKFSMSGQIMRIDQMRLVGSDTDVSAHGELRLTGSQPLDFRIQGLLNLKLLQRMYPETVSYGAANLTIHVVGPLTQPQMVGTVDINNAGISVVDLPNGLSQINGRLLLNQDRLQIERLSAHTGGGTLDLAGFIDYKNNRYFDVTATSKDVRLRYPAGISASADAHLRYTGTPQSSLLSGDIRIVRFAVDPHFDFAQYLERGKTGIRPAQNPLLDNLRLDVHVVTTPELRVETSLAKLSGDADLRIRGTVANPALLGRVNIAEGNISFNGTRYRLERGDITFNNPQVVRPVINVEMSSRVRGYDISIGFHGPIEKLSLTYRSDPPLPSGDIIALLAFGRTRQTDLYSNQPAQSLVTSDAALGQALNSASSSRVQKLFGVGSVKIDPQQIGSSENSFGPRVTIEQQIKDNVTLTYITNLSQSSSQQVIQAEVSLTKSISIVAVRDQNGILGFDLRIRKRKK